MKRGMVSSKLKDPGLGTGMAYMLENVPYREYLLTVTDQKEVSQRFYAACRILTWDVDEHM
jgi:hypothetical protein